MFDRIRNFVGNGVLFSLVLIAAPCRAEDADVLPSLYSSPEFQDGVMQKVDRQALVAGQRSLLGDQASPVKVSLAVAPPTGNAELQYQAQEGISRTLRRQIAETVSTIPGQPAGYRKVFAGDQLWQQFEHLVEGAGLSARNLADVMTSYYVGSWQIVHQVTAPPDSFRAVRDRMAQSLEKSPEIILMSDHEKQRSAEALGIMTVVASEGSQALLKQNDQIGYIALQNAVYQSLLKQGIDLKRLRLGGEGFVPG